MRIGSILLKNADIDFDALCNTVITVFHGAKDNYKYGDGTLVFDIESNMITVSLVDAPIPNGEAEFYHEWTEKLRTSKMPIPLWIYLGLIQDENGTSGYTYGLTAFGRPEIELINSSHTLQEIYDFLFSVCEWLLTEDMYFRDGETLSFTSEERLTMTKSKVVYVYGDSFKINF